MNITYFLGAGASAKAVPIWKEQANIMKSFALNKLKDAPDFSNSNNPYSPGATEYLMWEIGYFGAKGEVFGTIDTYAKKLILNGSNDELTRLKLAVSIFFTLWQLAENFPGKQSGKYSVGVDSRYISLLATLLEKTELDINPVLKENIKIVTWNYDLQFETAYKSFCLEDRSWKEIASTLHFTKRNTSTIQVCHLNGYSGYYFTETGEEIDILDRIDSVDYHEIMDEIAFTSKSHDRGSIHFTNHINYAWETNNPLARDIREGATNIFSKTDLLIVIGYSFPSFNKEVDKLLFSKLPANCRVVYQDPNANLDIIKELVLHKSIDVDCKRDFMDYFYLPYQF